MRSIIQKKAKQHFSLIFKRLYQNIPRTSLEVPPQQPGRTCACMCIVTSKLCGLCDVTSEARFLPDPLIFARLIEVFHGVQFR